MPAGWLNWYQSVAVLQHFGLELPTFAQWRWACHGREDQRWATGDDEADVLATANFQRRYFWAVDRHNSGADGAFARPNAFGLFHLHGNISEWLADPMVSRTMPTGQVVVGLERGRAGGSLVDALNVSSCERCDFNEARYQNPNIGLRPVRRIGYESSQSTGPDK
jgi:formylglycine-generating enzyme required for sulfatase activity